MVGYAVVLRSQHLNSFERRGSIDRGKVGGEICDIIVTMAINIYVGTALTMQSRVTNVKQYSGLGAANSQPSREARHQTTREYKL